MTTLVPLTSAAAILSGADKDNRMGVLAEGEKLALYANGKLLEEIEDDALTGEEGGFGVFVGARKSGTLTIGVKEIAYSGPLRASGASRVASSKVFSAIPSGEHSASLSQREPAGQTHPRMRAMVRP